METIHGNKKTNETLTGVSSSSNPSDDNQEILKPSSENEVSGDAGGGGRTTVVETTVVKMVQEDKKDEKIGASVEEFEIQENEEKGYSGNSVEDGGDEGIEGYFGNNMVEDGGDDGQKGCFGNSIVEEGGEEGKKVSCSFNGTSPVIDVNGSELKSVSEGNAGLINDENTLGRKESTEVLQGDASLLKDEKAPGQKENTEDGSEVKSVLEGNAGKLNDENAPGRKDSTVDGSEVKSVLEGNAGLLNDENAPGWKENTAYGSEVKSVLEGNAGLLNDENVPVRKENTEESLKLNKKIGKKQESIESGDDQELDSIEEEEHDYVIGDFVWGKIKSHPWWPGQVYDPSNASDYAATLHRKGRLLVAYFGDASFSWCSPSQLKPFLDSFPSMSVQADSKKFANAVQSALDELSWLVEAELTGESQTVDRVVVNRGIKAGVCVPRGNTLAVLIDRMNPIEILSTVRAASMIEPGSRAFELELVVVKSFLSGFYKQKGGFLLPEYHDPQCIEGLEDDQRSGIAADDQKGGPSESAENGKSNSKRKQKSVAELLREEPKAKKAKTTVSSRKRKALVVSVTPPESDNESGGGEEEMTSPRQRKKSKYLSPPYLSPVWFKEPKIEPEKVLESSGSGRKRNVPEQKKTVVDVTVDVNEVLNGLLRAALDPSSCKKKNLPEVEVFVSCFRSSVFEDGSGKRVYGPGRKKDKMWDLGIVEEKLLEIREMVKRCEDGEMFGEVKKRLEEGIEEVIEKVGEMK